MLAELTEVLARLPQEIRQGLNSGSALVRLRADVALFQSGLSSRLTALLAESGLLPEGEMGRFFVNHAQLLDAGGIARWLVDRAVSTSAPNAIAELVDSTTAQHFVAREILVLDGVSVDDAVQLTSDIRLQPLASLQCTGFRDQFDAGNEWTPSRNRVALVRTFDHPVIVKPMGSPHPPELLDLMKDETLRDVARLFTIISGVAPAIVAQWWEHHPNLPWGTPTTSASTTMGFESAFLVTRIEPNQIELIRQWIPLMQRCPRALWTTLRVVLDRLNAAKRRSGHVDVSIELGVAAEALFLRFSGEDTSELSFRLATRAAWFLGNGHDERVRVFDLFRLMYDARSKAVHNGVVPDRIKQKEVREVLTEGCELLELAVIKTLNEPEQDLQHIHLGPD